MRLRPGYKLPIRITSNSCCCLTCGFHTTKRILVISNAQSVIYTSFLVRRAELSDAVLERASERSGIPESEIGEARWELDTAIEDIIEYRGHMVRHFSEGDYNASRRRNPLACRFFGKRGSRVLDCKKKEKFAMAVTDDKLQDEIYKFCA